MLDSIKWEAAGRINNEQRMHLHEVLFGCYNIFAHAPVAQWIERSSYEGVVMGLNPIGESVSSQLMRFPRWGFFIFL